MIGMKTRLVFILMLLSTALGSAQAGEGLWAGRQSQEMTPNERQARRIFNSAYQQVFGEQGATLHYDEHHRHL